MTSRTGLTSPAGDGGNLNAITSPRRRTQGAPRNKCKACVRCRTRKIKCNGQWPTCAFCEAQGHECVYGQDGRQNSHIGKHSYTAMANKIAGLEDTIKQLESRYTNLSAETLRSVQNTQSPSGATVNMMGAAQLSEIPLVDNSIHGHRATSANLPTFQQTLLDSATQDVTSNASIVLPPETGSIFQTQFNTRPHETEVPENNDQAAGSEIAEHYGGGQNDVNVIVSNDSGISVHGQTSAFHFHERSPTSTSSHSKPTASTFGYTHGAGNSGSMDAKEFDQVRSQLFGFAAFQRQRELNFLLGDNSEVDCDGLDFDTAIHFLDIHWNRQHCAFLLSYRPIIMEHFATNGPYVNKLLLNAIYFASSLHSRRTEAPNNVADNQSTGLQFLTRFKSLLETELETSSVPSIVGLLLMGSSLVSHGRQTLGWLYCGLAYRMIIDLGLHLDTSTIQTSHSISSSAKVTFEIAEIEMHRRVFWGAYVNDKFQSLYFGRPPAIPKTGYEPPQIFLDNYEEMELWTPYIDPQAPNSGNSQYKTRPSFVVSSFQILIQLAEISADIIESFYRPQSSILSITAADQALKTIQDRLDRWHASIPAFLQFSPLQDPTPPPHQITPHTTFHTLRILAHRPFLPEGHLSHIGLNVLGIQNTCTTAATQIYEFARAYRDAFTFEHAPYLLSYALFSAVTVMPRNEASGTGFNHDTELIVFFWNALKELQRGANFGLKRPLVIVRDFLQRAGIDINRLSTRQNTPDRHMQPREHQGDLMNDETGNWNTSDLMTYLGDDYFDMYNTSVEPNFDWANVPANMEGPDILYGLFR